MSTTTNLGLFKHDNPSTNTDIFDIDKAINQNLDKIDLGIGKDRERLSLLEASNTIYNYKGKVDTLANLQSKAKIKGDVWYCEENSTYYACNGNEWIPSNLNLKLGVIDEMKSKVIKCMQEIETPTPISGTSINLTDSTEAKITELIISGNNKQETREGKNLLELREGTYTASGVTAIVKDGIITLNGTATETVPIYINLRTPITTLANVQYTLSTNNERTIGDSNNFCALRLNNEGTRQALLHNKNATYLQGSTIDMEITYITIRIASGTIFSNFVIKPQLELGNVASEWEQGGIAPSPDYYVEVESCGDNVNLFDGEYHDGKGYNTNTGALETNANLYCNKDYINISGGQRKVSLSKNGIGKNTRFFFYDNNKQYISTATGEKNIVVPENAIYLNFQITKSSVDNDRSNIKVEKGEPTSYSKYEQGNITVVIDNNLNQSENNYKCQNYEIPVQEEMLEGDMFNWESEQEVHTWDKYIITGNENWKKHNSTNNNSFYLEASAIITNILTPTNNDEKGTIINTHYNNYVVNNIVFNNIIGTGLATGSVFYIATGVNGISSVSDFKTWLKSQYESGTPVTIYYKKLEEKRIPFTEEQKEIAKQIINNAKTYDKVTHIYSTDNVSPNISIIYKKDIEKVFNNIVI